MNRVVIFANTTKPEVIPVADRMVSYLSSRGEKVMIVALSATDRDRSLEVPDADIAVSLGGDGTVLNCINLLKGRNIPLIPVKVGTFGYITDTQASEFSEVYEAYLEGKASIQKRLMLDISVVRGERECFKASALNEVALTAATRARMAAFRLFIDNVRAADLKGDGIIIASPTGSTAYSLAAGGPVLDAGLSAIIVNPICPFTMSIRPLVVGSEKEIRIEIPPQSAALSITADGHVGFDIRENDIITVKKSCHEALLVENPSRSFIELLRDKLGWAGGLN